MGFNRRIAMNKTILVIAAHSDDETLGCGGTIARHIAEGDLVHIVFLTDGVGSRSKDNPGAKDVEARKVASSAALMALGVTKSNTHVFSFPDNAIDSVSRLEVVKALEGVFDSVKPDVVYTHHSGDLNIDHRYAFEATMTACRPQPGSTVKEIYSFEVPSSTGWSGASFERHFQPQVFVDIKPFWSNKASALEAYKEEMREFPHARSVKAVRALAHFRGSQVGFEMAEAFVAERIIK